MYQQSTSLKCFPGSLSTNLLTCAQYIASLEGMLREARYHQRQLHLDQANLQSTQNYYALYENLKELRQRHSTLQEEYEKVKVTLQAQEELIVQYEVAMEIYEREYQSARMPEASSDDKQVLDDVEPQDSALGSQRGGPSAHWAVSQDIYDTSRTEGSRDAQLVSIRPTLLAIPDYAMAKEPPYYTLDDMKDPPDVKSLDLTDSLSAPTNINLSAMGDSSMTSTSFAQSKPVYPHAIDLTSITPHYSDYLIGFTAKQSVSYIRDDLPNIPPHIVEQWIQ